MSSPRKRTHCLELHALDDVNRVSAVFELSCDDHTFPAFSGEWQRVRLAPELSHYIRSRRPRTPSPSAQCSQQKKVPSFSRP